MSTVHAQTYVRESHLRAESRLPRSFTAHGLTLQIAPATRRVRLVGELCSIRHDARWTLGSRTGPAVVDLVPAASDLTELIVQTRDDARPRRRADDARRAILRRFVVAVRDVIVDDSHPARAARDATAMTEPWRTPA
jgi:hypothetical protein